MYNLERVWKVGVFMLEDIPETVAFVRPTWSPPEERNTGTVRERTVFGETRATAEKLK